MDDDILGVLPVDIDIVVIESTDLGRYNVLGFLATHWDCVVKDHPSQHVEGSGIPTFRNTGRVHLQHELLKVLKGVPRVGEVVDEI